MAWASVLQSLHTHLPREEMPVVLATSGGVDSQVLLHLLGTQGYTAVICVYCDHGFRTDTDQDKKVVQQLAQSFGFPVIIRDIASDLIQGNRENTARDRRYEVLEEVRSKLRADYILTAHHGNDLIESQILHEERGAGLYGQVGIRLVDERRRLLRPLLGVQKGDIVSYAKEYGIPWHEDSTNADDRLQRNRVRKKVQQHIAENPHLIRDARVRSDGAIRIIAQKEQEIFAVLGDVLRNKKFSYTAYLELSKDVQKHFLVMMERWWGTGYTSRHIDALHKRLGGSFTTGKKLIFSGGTEVLRFYDDVYIDGLPEVPTPPLTSVQIPTVYPLDTLKLVTLRSKDRVRLYRGPSNEIWHTSVKKWRQKHHISSLLVKNLIGVQGPDGDIIGIFHTAWTLPSSLPCSTFAI